MPTPSSSGSLKSASSAASKSPPEVASIGARVPIQALTPEDVCAQVDCDLTTARKICAGVHQRGDDELGVRMPKMSRRKSVDAMVARYRVGKLEVVAREASSLDPFVKYVLACEDGARIEAVRIPLEKSGRFVVCVSSQVGCAIGCRFCATGRMGLQRNLEAWEIVEQVRVVRRDLPAGGRVHGVVFQGMGEPLANVERVMAAIRVLHHPCGASIDQRAITVCTVGVPSAIRKLAASGLRVRLGLSITAARPRVRRSLVPIEDSNPLAEVLEAAAEYVAVTGDAPMFAVTPLSGVNTGDEDIEAFGAMVQAFRARTGVSPRVSIVPYNTIGGDSQGGDDPFVRAGDEESKRFRDRLSALGVPVVLRYSGGSDVGAACGQLVARAGTSSGEEIAAKAQRPEGL
jgi:23S rRNA (adenine2503-C2)-methyltransferase